MEFHVKNNYIKRFLSQYKGQSELKLLKYLTIIGIHTLQSQGGENVAYVDIEKMASKYFL